MIKLHNDGVSHPIQNTSKLGKWIRLVAENYGKEVGSINYIFCSNERILELNRQYLNHDYHTDIITFNYNKNKQIEGDIFIGLETVQSNADEYRVSFEEELNRVMIHGVLHLCGLDDASDEEEQNMREQEDIALQTLSQIT